MRCRNIQFKLFEQIYSGKDKHNLSTKKSEVEGLIQRQADKMWSLSLFMIIAALVAVQAEDEETFALVRKKVWLKSTD